MAAGKSTSILRNNATMKENRRRRPAHPFDPLKVSKLSMMCRWLPCSSDDRGDVSRCRVLVSMGESASKDELFSSSPLVGGDDFGALPFPRPLADLEDAAGEFSAFRMSSSVASSAERYSSLPSTLRGR